jgi:hypothetical protein
MKSSEPAIFASPELTLIAPYGRGSVEAQLTMRRQVTKYGLDE